MSNQSYGKNNTSVLGLTPVQPQASSALNLDMPGSIDPLQIPPSQAITKRERQILENVHGELLMIGAIEAKAEFGMYQIGQMQKRASDLFGNTVSFMVQNREQARGTVAEPYVAEFTMRQIQMYARHMLGTLEVAGTRIGEEVHRSLNLPPEEKGFWARVFGK